MRTTTPPTDPPSRTLNRTRSKSPLTRSRPITPLRPSSRSSLRDSATRGRGPYTSSSNPLEDLSDQFAELSDAMADLESNFVALQTMHESLSRFSESFAGFLYGLNMNAFCVDFSEAPIPESFKRPQNNPAFSSSFRGPEPDVEATFLTTDTSFIENPPSSRMASKFQNPVTPAPAQKMAGTGRGRGGIPRAGRGGGIPRGAPRGGRGGSGIARGAAGRRRGAR
ncbi:hypothetical protein K458DRAFT_476916 [Lentithecium fluviatile CBS 122367]|uniref:DASH complex subunit DAM1 n=1 Tax=Lentithecium fluviatile CBS 122367 TaxID=1168545 RepID=A0A6G1J4R6_9PLEO|nr:hypothetical protein K458DRAFT_476916 [Lentithecium fluviatile CBS 122367]